MSNYYDVNFYSGGGGLVSTAYDYRFFLNALEMEVSLMEKELLVLKL